MAVFCSHVGSFSQMKFNAADPAGEHGIVGLAELQFCHFASFLSFSFELNTLDLMCFPVMGVR